LRSIAEGRIEPGVVSTDTFGVIYYHKSACPEKVIGEFVSENRPETGSRE
jgi:hypothetical protein